MWTSENARDSAERDGEAYLDAGDAHDVEEVIPLDEEVIDLVAHVVDDRARDLRHA